MQHKEPKEQIKKTVKELAEFCLTGAASFYVGKVESVIEDEERLSYLVQPLETTSTDPDPAHIAYLLNQSKDGGSKKKLCESRDWKFGALPSYLCQ